MINPKPGQRPPGWQPGEKPGGRPGQPSTLPANRQNLYNRPGNENRLASRPGQPASGVVPAPGQGRERPGAQPARPGQAAGPKAEARPAQAAKPAQPKVKPAGGPNNVLADKNGNVYKRDNQGNMRPAAKPATRPTASSRPAAASRPTPRPSVDNRQLNRDYAARQRGEVRTQNFARASAPRPSAPRPSPSISRPSGGGGGGGARRRWWWRRSRWPALGKGRGAGIPC